MRSSMPSGISAGSPPTRQALRDNATRGGPSTKPVPPAESERAGASMTQEPPLALFAWSASPDCAATNSNNAKDGTYPSKREGQRGVGGTWLAEARSAPDGSSDKLRV